MRASEPLLVLQQGVDGMQQFVIDTHLSIIFLILLTGVDDMQLFIVDSCLSIIFLILSTNGGSSDMMLDLKETKKPRKHSFL